MYQPDHKAIAARTAEVHRANRGKATAALFLLLGVMLLLNLVFYAIGVLQIPDFSDPLAAASPVSPAVSLLTTLATLLVSAPLTLGLMQLYGRMARGEPARLSSIFDWLSDVRLLLRSVRGELWYSLLYLGWMIVYMMPGVLVTFVFAGISPQLSFWLGYAVMLGGAVFATAKILSLTPALFLLADGTETSVISAFDTVRRVMSPLRWRYFRFLLRYALVLLAIIVLSGFFLSYLMLLMPSLGPETLFLIEYVLLVAAMGFLMPRLLLGMVVYWQDAFGAQAGENPPKPDIYGL